MQLRQLVFVLVGLATIVPTCALAQVPDHLKCYKIKDSAPKAVYTADLGGLTSEPGCQVKVPAKLLCVETAKQNVNPTPPGGGPTPTAAGMFVCYKVKCTKAVLAPVPVNDQFGARSVQPSVAKMLCAPADSGTTTTTAMSTTSTSSTTTAGPTTTTSSTSTTTTSTSSTTTSLPACSNAAAPQCNGSCGGGQTCIDLGGLCGCF